jgi:hypothetical protein
MLFAHAYILTKFVPNVFGNENMTFFHSSSHFIFLKLTGWLPTTHFNELSTYIADPLRNGSFWSFRKREKVNLTSEAISTMEIRSPRLSGIPRFGIRLYNTVK